MKALPLNMMLQLTTNISKDTHDAHTPRLGQHCERSSRSALLPENSNGHKVK